MIGKSVEETKKLLSKRGITKIEIINNFSHEIEGSTHLVTNCQIVGDKAVLTIGSFKL